MTKYKYYFKKPKGEITKDVLLWLAISGAIIAAVAAPKAVSILLREFSKKYPHKKKSSDSAFRRLLKDGSINIEQRGPQIYISLTEQGRRRAGWLQINNLKIKKQKKWDRNWRIVMFDIPHSHRIVREALRGFLKNFGFLPFQKSVWIHPFDCKDEVELLKDFFKLSASEISLVVARDIGDDRTLRKHFRL
ncbi:MAG: hypothetical protein A3F26_01055 [Candidatus Ryanbacteria bacterium RIFCSPHIGHO2_12_FULL_47_12b]|uniref:Transcriptional repressor PaaX-like central Cas2-like domain-containing protein n=2 Tax=Candidatus Ryaniibacteriota TaxID=1817914 RepID=A0A1G2H432_9BACT|nr:MAG: hypothetical protein UX74_C0020G0003 [Parcubacteria group bacterium GW2011_GWA2_47_10b]OGZ52647.1 MAG: hypothetical protein A3F26_01055 [Candidatus Ryanbacteria bacterium RIFCSPHIGHO2_12_FULL_47_12b]OGZ56221.1 MAG: hypothetical protein A3J04_01875 [Candidatus Ryanbacteria bacterium RIFCSPLOWO2_02_FULL_47_14]OGZ57254.1 MAG: hypothetical protein A3G60_03800 [Candidatus Ryanbacteria bacterium RIFCSPLOWO2_12_FULL_47_9c]